MERKREREREGVRERGSIWAGKANEVKGSEWVAVLRCVRGSASKAGEATLEACIARRILVRQTPGMEHG